MGIWTPDISHAKRTLYPWAIPPHFWLSGGSSIFDGLSNIIWCRFYFSKLTIRWVRKRSQTKSNVSSSTPPDQLVFFLYTTKPQAYRIVVALDEMHSSAVLSSLVFFLWSRSWGRGEYRERPVGTGKDGTLAGGVWLRLQADRQTDRQTGRPAITKIETQFYKLTIKSSTSTSIYIPGTCCIIPGIRYSLHSALSHKIESRPRSHHMVSRE